MPLTCVDDRDISRAVAIGWEIGWPQTVGRGSHHSSNPRNVVVNVKSIFMAFGMPPLTEVEKSKFQKLMMIFIR